MDEAVPRGNLGTVDRELRRLVSGEPIQYVTGVAHFYGLELEVGEGVLIPRPETEELVRWILESHRPSPSLSFVDICCGSGCIAVALARKRLAWRGIALDVSPYAIDYTRRNLVKHDLGGHVQTIRADALKKWPSHLREVDIIVANPPYIPVLDWGRVAADVAAYEPVVALRVEDDAPLLFYERIAAQAYDGLADEGWLYFECNDRYVQQVVAVLSERDFIEVEVLLDMQGRERHVRGRLLR